MKRIHDVGCACRECFSSGRDSLSALQEVIDRLNKAQRGACNICWALVDVSDLDNHAKWHGGEIGTIRETEPTKHVHRFRGSEICIDCGANMDYISTTPIKE